MTGRLRFNLRQALRAVTLGNFLVRLRNDAIDEVWKASSMNQCSCDLCDNPAVIHDTLSRSGVVKVRHLCRAHGLKTWREALPDSQTTPQVLAKNPVFQSLVSEAGKPTHRRNNTQPPAS